jgi:hypothetical protein
MGKVRPCIDYRRLNSVTENDAFPLPRIQDCLDAVSGPTLYSTMDLTSGYHQFPVRNSDIPKTAFVTKYGLYEFLKMPMGLKSAPMTFQRVMELALQGLQWQICLIYLHDVVIFSKTFDEHMERLTRVFDRISTAGLKLKPEKCQLLQTEVTFLGHVVSGEGVRPHPSNILKIKEWPPPQTVTQIRQFLGMASYYRRFVKDFSQIVRPMVQLTKKGADFIWSEACTASFEEVKNILTTAPVMAYPRDEGGYILDTDACDVSIGAALSQIQDGQEKVIAYGSRKLNKAETNYCVTDKELLALRHFVEYYPQYLPSTSLKEPKGRIARWLEILSAFEFSIQHRPGSKHGNADGMSRCPSPEECLCSDVDSLEYLKCGPCKKCTKRALDMESSMKINITDCKSVSFPYQKTGHHPLRAETTRSSKEENDHTLWTS